MSNKPVIPEQAFTLYDQFAHGLIQRRDFMRGISKLAVGALTSSVLLEGLMPNYALAEQVSFNDPDIIANFTEFDSPNGHGKGRGYLVTPAKVDGKLPCILVIHENRGLNPYIQDVARRLAKQGFIALAPDGLFPLGGYPGNDEKGKEMQRSMDKDKLAQDFFAAADFLKTLPQGNGKVGAVGFCYGGGMVNKLLTEHVDVIAAGVSFYGSAPNLTLVKNIKAPLMVQMGELDERVNSQWPDYEKALVAQKANYQAFTYAGAHHGFHNDSTARYDKAHAELAWQRSVDFFKQHLN